MKGLCENNIPISMYAYFPSTEDVISTPVKNMQVVDIWGKEQKACYRNFLHIYNPQIGTVDIFHWNA